MLEICTFFPPFSKRRSCLSSSSPRRRCCKERVLDTSAWLSIILQLYCCCRSPSEPRRAQNTFLFNTKQNDVAWLFLSFFFAVYISNGLNILILPSKPLRNVQELGERMRGVGWKILIELLNNPPPLNVVRRGIHSGSSANTGGFKGLIWDNKLPFYGGLSRCVVMRWSGGLTAALVLGGRGVTLKYTGAAY